jgi:hypothetical protein
VVEDFDELDDGGWRNTEPAELMAGLRDGPLGEMKVWSSTISRRFVCRRLCRRR